MANHASRRFLPRGIYGRAALILFLPIVTLMLVVSVMFLQRHFDGVTRQMTGSMVRELGFVADQIAGAKSLPQARAAAQSVAVPLGLAVTLPADGPVRDARRWYDFSGRTVTAELYARLPAVVGVDLARDEKQVRVLMEGRHGPYTLGFERGRVSASNPHQLLVLMGMTAVLMSGIAVIFLRNQMRPIKRLARAAEEYGKGRVVPYRLSGAVEVRSAGAAFLDMRNRIERSNEQRTLMLSGISHDLRTPLTRLRLSVSMLGDDGPPDPADLAAMAADIDEMGRMIDAFLDFARDEAQDSAPEPVPVRPFVQAILADAQRAGQPVTLGLVEAGDERVVLRPDLLRRAIENLLANAIKFGSRAEVDVIITPAQLLVAVEDDGPGIPDIRRDDALRPFTRLDPARGHNRGQGGVGLGLSIAADVARGHGGSLRLASGARLGGLRAEIRLPR